MSSLPRLVALACLAGLALGARGDDPPDKKRPTRPCPSWPRSGWATAAPSG